MLELVGKKIGMTHTFMEDGRSVPLTLVKLYDNLVIDLKVNEGKDFNNALLAFERAEKNKNLSKPLVGIFNKKSVPVFKKIHGSRVAKDSKLKVGESVAIDSILKEGDKISIQGVTVGKGFAGAMKRWNFAGLEASHGVSISHRSHGSTGQRQDPGKVFKGKKMAGHLGTEKVTVKNIEVKIIDKDQSLVALKGSIPGNPGNDVILKIAENN
jgi:large subunit ribosomal protein L3